MRPPRTSILDDADTEPADCLPGDKIMARQMQLGSTALLRAMERARGKYDAEPVRTPEPKRHVSAVSQITAIPGINIGWGIIGAVAEAYGMTVPELLGRGRKRRHVHARAVAARLLRDVKWGNGTPHFSFPQIAKMVNRMDHTTICYALGQFDVYCRYDPEVRAVYAALKGMGC